MKYLIILLSLMLVSCSNNDNKYWVVKDVKNNIDLDWGV